MLVAPERATVTKTLHSRRRGALACRHPTDMKTATMWRVAARWLRRVESSPRGCSVAGCRERPTLAVAGDQTETIFMCVHHAVAWSESALCHDYAQHNSRATPAALAAWLG
jgi:hypothetical protein